MKKIITLAMIIIVSLTFNTQAEVNYVISDNPDGPAVVNGRELKYEDYPKLTLDEVKKEVSEHPDKYYQLTFLFWICAVYNNDERILQVLIDELKINPARQQNYLDRIFGSAVRNSNNVEIIKKLVGLGAEIKGDILLQALQRNPNLDIARYLIEAGADVKAKDKNGNTALIYLFDREPKVDAPDIVQKLIDGGVDVNDYDLKNPLEYAHVCKLKKSEKLLIKAGAKVETSFGRLKRIGMDCKRYSTYSRADIIY